MKVCLYKNKTIIFLISAITVSLLVIVISLPNQQGSFPVKTSHIVGGDAQASIKQKVNQSNQKKVSLTQHAVKKGRRMKFSKNSVRELWEAFLIASENSKEREDILSQLLSSSDAGRVLFKEISDFIYQGRADDSVTSTLIEILAYGYEGGSVDNNTTADLLNEKDQIIQDLLREQLKHPSGKLSLKATMNLLYMVENDGQKNILEDTLQRNGHLLTEAEELKYRLHYGFSNSDRLTEIISSLPAGKKDSNIFRTISFEFTNTILLDKIKTHSPLRNVLRQYLDDNPVNFENYKSLSSDEQIRLSEDYTSWLRIYGATLGEGNIDNYLYESSLTEKNPQKILSVIDFQLEESEYSEDDTEVQRLINNPEINAKLRSGIYENQLDEHDKKRLQIILGIKSYEEVYGSTKAIKTTSEFKEKLSLASEKDKKRIQSELVKQSTSEELSQLQKEAIKRFLENNF